MAGCNDGKRRLEDFLSTASLPVAPAGTCSEMFKAILMRENVDAVLKAMYNQGSAETAVMEDEGAVHAIGVIAKSNNAKKQFYAKIIWESGLREALALELSNLCTGRVIPYLLCEGVIFTDKVRGGWLDIYELRKNIQLEHELGCFSKAVEQYACQYGMIEEFSRFIGLDDRRGDNIIIKENGEYWNIDFGQSFMHNSGKKLRELVSCNLPIPQQKYQHLAENGAEEAKKTIRANIGNNIAKISAMLNCICEEDYDEMKSGFSLAGLQHPKDVLLNYATRNGWDEIASRLK